MRIPGIEININNLAKEAFQEIVNVLPEASYHLMKDDIGEVYRENMVSLAPFKWGDLREGHIVEETGNLEIAVYSDVPHFKFVVAGTQPHWIYPKGTFAGATYMGQEIMGHNGGYLYWVGADHPVWRVYHPGTQPNDYPAEAFTQAEPEIDSKLQEYLNNVFGESS